MIYHVQKIPSGSNSPNMHFSRGKVWARAENSRTICTSQGGHPAVDRVIWPSVHCVGHAHFCPVLATIARAQTLLYRVFGKRVPVLLPVR
eukprot:gene9387-biopygen22717